MPKRNPEAQAEALLARMTTEEMLRQMSVFTPDNADHKHGIGHMTTGEACHGVSAAGATVFPQALSMGATFDPALIREIGAAVAREARAFGIHMVFAPMLSLSRDARWGRVEESFGEDAQLVSEMGCAYIDGLQGTGEARFDESHVLCVAKHFVADGEPSKGINGAPVNTSEDELRETAMLPFERAVACGVAGIMPAHHSVNRVPCHANRHLLCEILRDEWGFDGVVVSDMLDIPKLYAYGGRADGRDHHQHRVAEDETEAAYLALNAGVDAELGGYYTAFEDRSYGKRLLNAFASGRFPSGEALIRRAAKRVIAAKFRLGLQENAGLNGECAQSVQYTDETDGEYYAAAIKRGEALPGDERLNSYEKVRASVDFEAHARLALRAAEESAVLLKNEGILPLNLKRLKRIAVIGPNAAACPLGGYTNPHPRYAVSLLEGVKAYVGDSAEIVYAEGCVIAREDNEYGAEWENRRAEYIRGVPEAAEAARGADVALIAVGGNRSVCGENTDVDETCLTWAQRTLIREVYATGTPIVLIVIDGRPVSIPWESERLPAILHAFYLGQESGTALARILFGEVSPSGKLPMAIPRRASHIPVLYNALYWGSPKRYIGSDMPCTPLYPFGFGLSYTRFEFSAPRLDCAEISEEETAIVSVEVRNVGDRAGAEVVQMYIQDAFASVVRPLRELKGFKKVFLNPNEKRTVSFEIGFEQLRFRKGGKWIVEPGEFRIYLGSDCTCENSIALRVR